MDYRPKVEPKTIKVTEGNVGEKLCNIGFGNYFWDITPKGQATKAKLEKKWDYIKRKNCTSKETINRVKGNL